MVTSIGPGALQAFAGSLAAASNGVGVYHIYGDETTFGEGYNMQQVPKEEQGLFGRLTAVLGQSYVLHTPEGLRDALRRGANCVHHPYRAGPFFLLLPLNTQPARMTVNLAALPARPAVPKLAPASFAIVPEAGDILIDAKTMLAAVGKPGIALLDVRDVDEWIGESSSPYGKDYCPRKGRIPGAVWLEWYRMMKPTGEGPRFKSKDEILAECATVGITENTPVYLYCFKGARASNTFLALKNAGVKDVRMYFGSWNEWSRDPSLPIEEGLPTDARLTEKAA